MRGVWGGFRWFSGALGRLRGFRGFRESFEGPNPLFSFLKRLQGGGEFSTFRVCCSGFPGRAIVPYPPLNKALYRVVSGDYRA